MYYDIKQLENPPVLLGTWYKGFRFVEHGKDYTVDIQARWKALTTPVFYILDMSHLDMITFEGVMRSTHSGTQGSSSSLKHPLNRGTIFVTKSSIIKAVAKGLKSDAFGNVDIKLFSSIDQALAYVKNLIDAGQEQTG